MNGDRFADLDHRSLQSWLSRELNEPAILRSITKFPGGQSNPTYLLETDSRKLVLRRKPFGKLLPSAHAVEREYRLMAALRSTPVPVPEAIALCEDREIIGAPFFIMQMVEGRIFWKGDLPECTTDQGRETYRELIGVLARLHAIVPDKVGLGDFGAPGNYFERQVGRWTKQYRASQTDDIAEIERLIEWLPSTLPRQERVSIIHGDYRLDNMIFAPDRARILAIIDWELSTLGDPLADFAYFAMNWAMPHGVRGAQLGGLDLKELGIPTLDEATEQYCELTGRDSVPDLNWYFAYNLFRLVGIIQGIKKRAIEGNASSANAEAAVSRILPLAKQACAFADQAKL
ncbi:phosphotransferase family protein [Altererythrobacter sp.]|uniref:phosphotransferase family protein n=1 Tax=Altererythrobacter sp. TaxID=1872480 RepID=UPI003D071ED6